MLTVLVFVPSYDWSGDTHLVAVGDHVSWRLAVIDEDFVPEHLLTTVKVTAEPVEEPYPTLNYYPTLVRRGAFAAWWDADRPVVGRVELRAAFAIGDSRLPAEGGVLEAEGVVTRLYWALDLLRQRPDGPWARVPGVGLAEVDSTETTPDQGFTAYFPAPGVDANDGRWEHIGWFAMLQCE